MKTLKLKNIAGYIPYELKFRYYDPERECEEIIQLREVLIDDWKDDYSHYYNGMNDYHLLPDEVTPILRPVSDLYRTITHKGKEIIPLVECAKIASTLKNLNLRWEIEIPDINANSWDEQHEKILYSFHFRNNEFVLTKINWNRGYPYERIDGSQIEIFDYLNKLKIDYRGLIDSRRAIDANKLDNNPYNKIEKYEKY
jgi:hypothetical protein